MFSSNCRQNIKLVYLLKCLLWKFMDAFSPLCDFLSIQITDLNRQSLESNKVCDVSRIFWVWVPLRPLSPCWNMYILLGSVSCTTIYHFPPGCDIVSYAIQTPLQLTYVIYKKIFTIIQSTEDFHIISLATCQQYGYYCKGSMTNEEISRNITFRATPLFKGYNLWCIQGHFSLKTSEVIMRVNLRPWGCTILRVIKIFNKIERIYECSKWNFCINLAKLINTKVRKIQMKSSLK